MRFITHDEDFEVTAKNEVHGKIVVKAGTLEFPQVDSSAEFIEKAGGEEKAVELMNDILYSRSKNGALAIVRNIAKDGTIAEGISKAQLYSKSYDPSAERVSKAAVLEGVDSLRALKASGELAGKSQEELLALLTATLKI